MKLLDHPIYFFNFTQTPFSFYFLNILRILFTMLLLKIISLY
jgi:hypothetical protein